VVFTGAGSWDPPSQPPSNWLTGLVDGATNLVGIAGPDTDYVKRVIGIPGDHVVCCNASGQVTVNGVPLSESSYVFPNDVPSQMSFNITVPSGRLWVMGDNRGDSDDSRYGPPTLAAGPSRKARRGPGVPGHLGRSRASLTSPSEYLRAGGAHRGRRFAVPWPRPPCG